MLPVKRLPSKIYHDIEKIINYSKREFLMLKDDMHFHFALEVFPKYFWPCYS